MNEALGPDKILAVSRAFMESRILLTAAELDLFTLLENPLTATEITERSGWKKRPLVMLLDALSAAGFLSKNGKQYQTPAELLPFLSANSPQTVTPMIRHAATIWKSWSNLTDIVKEKGGPERKPGTYRDPKELQAFIGAMHVVGRKLAEDVVAAIDPSDSRSVIDVGGGSGTYTLAFLKANPDLRVTLFDQPDVIDMARERLSSEGMLSRVSLAAGDFYEDDLPKGHDLALLSAIIHMNSPEQNTDLYRKVFQTLDSGGRIVIRDHVMSPDRTSPKSGALFAINMLVNTPGGGTYTFDEIAAGLKAAGFEKVRLIQNDDRMSGLVEAFKP